MHVTAKKLVMSGMFLAVSMICMMLGSVIQTNTLFLLAAASYFVGIVLRECGGKLGVAFYMAAILLGWMLVPEKLYVGSYAAMGLYILLEDRLWDFLGKKETLSNRRTWFFFGKWLIFNLIYLSSLAGMHALIFDSETSWLFRIGVWAAGQVLFFLYDRAYGYVREQVWGKIRGRILG